MPTVKPQVPIRISSREEDGSVIFTQHEFGKPDVELCIWNRRVFDKFPGTFPLVQALLKQMVEAQLQALGFQTAVVTTPEGKLQ